MRTHVTSGKAPVSYLPGLGVRRPGTQSLDDMPPAACCAWVLRCSRTGEGLHKDLHTTTQAEHQVEGGLLLDVVVRQGAAILKLLASKDQTLLVRGDALLVLDLRLDIVDGVRRLHLQGDGLAGEGLNKDLHLQTLRNRRELNHRKHPARHRTLQH
jgi:hypothetical protein